MKSASELKRELAAAQKRERLATIQCTACDGAGWYSDTTYDRTGIDVRCGKCHGTGLPVERIDDLIAAAIKPFRKNKDGTLPPSQNSEGKP